MFKNIAQHTLFNFLCGGIWPFLSNPLQLLVRNKSWFQTSTRHPSPAKTCSLTLNHVTSYQKNIFKYVLNPMPMLFCFCLSKHQSQWDSVRKIGHNGVECKHIPANSFQYDGLLFRCVMHMPMTKKL